MTIKEIENSIIEKLNTNITDLKVEGYPESPDAYRLNHPKGAVLAHYFGSDFGEPLLGDEPSDFVAQEEKELFVVTLSIRGLRTHQGAYDYINGIKDILTGYQPIDSLKCKKMYPKQIRFISQMDGVWTYKILFSVKLLTQEIVE